MATRLKHEEDVLKDTEAAASVASAAAAAAGATTAAGGASPPPLPFSSGGAALRPSPLLDPKRRPGSSVAKRAAVAFADLSLASPTKRATFSPDGGAVAAAILPSPPPPSAPPSVGASAAAAANATKPAAAGATPPKPNKQHASPPAAAAMFDASSSGYSTPASLQTPSPGTAAAAAAAADAAAAAAAAAANANANAAAAAAAALPPPPLPPLAQALRAVVKIFTTMARPNYASPWTTHPQTTCTSTGWVLADEDDGDTGGLAGAAFAGAAAPAPAPAGASSPKSALTPDDAAGPPAPCLKRRIVTNAHCTSDHVSLTVRRHGSTRRWPARLVCVSHEADLAVITVDDDAFWWHEEERPRGAAGAGGAGRQWGAGSMMVGGGEEGGGGQEAVGSSGGEEDTTSGDEDDDDEDSDDEDSDDEEEDEEGQAMSDGDGQTDAPAAAAAAAATPAPPARARRPAVGALRLMRGEPPVDVEVAVVGFPVGGDAVCVTRGVVSRLDRVFYAHGRTSHLAVQVSAAINSGNSGGPAVVFPGEAKRAVVLGVAFQALSTSQNCGHCVPAFLLRHLLRDHERAERGAAAEARAAAAAGGGRAGSAAAAARSAAAFAGPRSFFPALGASFQKLESADAHKAALGLPGAVAIGRRSKAERRAARAARAERAAAAAAAASASAAAAEDGGAGGDSAGTAPTAATTTGRPPSSSGNKAASGVLLTFVEPTSPAAGLLRVGDVLARVDGHEVADDGTTLLVPGAGAGFALPAPPSAAARGGGRGGGGGSQAPEDAPDHHAHHDHHDHHDHNHGAVRVDFRHLISRRSVGDALSVAVWRAGALRELSVPLAAPCPLVRPHSHDARPSYAVFGGLVLTPLTVWYLRQTWGAEWHHRAPLALTHPALAGVRRLTDEQVVVLSRVLAASGAADAAGGPSSGGAHITAAYQDEGHVVVRRVDGVRVRSLRHCLALLLRGTTREARAAAGFGAWRPEEEEEEGEGEGMEAGDKEAGEYDPDDGFDDAAEEAQMAEAMAAAAERAAGRSGGGGGAGGGGGGGDGGVSPRHRYVRVSLSWGDQIVLDRAAALAATAGVLKSNSIAAAASEDLLPPAPPAPPALAAGSVAAAAAADKKDAASRGGADKKKKKGKRVKPVRVDDLIVESEEEEEGMATAHAA